MDTGRCEAVKRWRYILCTCSPKKKSFREWIRSEIEEATKPEEDKEIFFKVFTWLEAQKLLRVNNLRDKNGDVKSAEKKN